MTTEPEPRDEKEGLLFAWRPSRPLVASVGIFVIASLVIHLFGFYLFQVVYPAAGRLEPEPSRVTLLSEDQPSVGALLRKVEDRLVYLRPASEGSDVRVALGDFSAQFQPSFSDRAIAFKSELPAAVVQGRAGGIEDPLDPNSQRTPRISLPPLATVSSRAPAPVGEAVSRWRFSGDLLGRLLRDAEKFEAALPVLGEPPAIRFRIGVEPGGRVQSVLPVAGIGHPKLDEISVVLRSTLRFEPKPGAETEWGWLDISR